MTTTVLKTKIKNEVAQSKNGVVIGVKMLSPALDAALLQGSTVALEGSS